MPPIQNFQYFNPTKLVFGKGTIAKLAELLPENVKKVCLTYGGGSIKKNGVYDQVVSALNNRGVSFMEFGGIEPNPSIETLCNCVDKLKQENVDFIIACGGGSVIDGSKYISAATLYTDSADPWAIPQTGGKHIKAAIPLGVVLTIPATGSEANCGAVVSRKATKDKQLFSSDLLFPRFSILDPSVTLTLPTHQVYNGICDAWVHVFEQYLTAVHKAPVHDRQAEALLLAFRDIVPQFQANPSDYQVRADIMWACTQALNYHLNSGKNDRATHVIGHEITALYGLDHAKTLTAINPSLLSHPKVRAYKRAILLQMGERVFGVSPTEGGEEHAIDRTIGCVREFYHSCGMKTSLSGWGIDPKECAEAIFQKFKARNLKIGEFQTLEPEDVRDILLAAN
eukprot:GCRY01001575.1.p1 GENE.GCRY01001575.1~~GCRY01001575.1.p1  ORF type:complete len:397 (-),score=110.53 GCRY01001575.1:207-1397(-)